MDESLVIDLEEPRFETRPVVIAGARRIHVGSEAVFADMERQQDEATARFSEVSDRVGERTWCAFFDMFSAGPEFEMMFGVEAANSSGPPLVFDRLSLPSQRYVIFPHRGSVDLMRNTVHTVWHRWLPASGLESLTNGAEMPEFIEVSGGEVMEAWFPVKG
jgi:AraC family transcriptional regulator